MKQHLADKTLQTVPLNSGFWVAFILFGQGLCAAAFSWMVRIPLDQVLVPILVLFLGGICSTLFCVMGKACEEGGRRWIIPAVFYGIFIALMSHKWFWGVRVPIDTNYFHLVEYATLGLLLGKFWYRVIDEKGFASFALRVLLTAGMFGIADEIHQGFVPGRDADIGDILRDLAGVSISIVIVAAIRYLLRSRAATRPSPSK